MVATVDAVNGSATLDKHIESVRQAALADRILITKLDLLGAAEAKAAETALTARLRRLNPAATISRLDDPALDIGGLLRAAGVGPGSAGAAARAWLNAAAYEQRDGDQHLAGEGHDHDDDHAHHDGHAHHDHHGLHDRDIASFCFIREQPIAREALRLLLDALQQNSGPTCSG